MKNQQRIDLGDYLARGIRHAGKHFQLRFSRRASSSRARLVDKDGMKTTNSSSSSGSEMANLINRKPITTCHIIQFPAGTWGFVGCVPATLAFVDKKTGGPATEEQIRNAAQFGARVSGVKTASWATREEALAAAAAIGVEVKG